VKLRLISALLLSGPATLFAQQAFEVASIKPANPDQAMSIMRSGNRLTFSNYSVEMLILWGYDIRSERLLGKPKGLDSARYDIVAVAPAGPAVAGRLNLMMQALLAERFRLVVHKETRELPHYAMVVDKSGLKVLVKEPGGSVSQNPFAMTANGHLTGTQVSAGMLAKVLTDQTGRFVEDSTRLTGVFDFTLNWASDTNSPNVPESGPSIFTAVKEQLGLRLDAVKGPVEVIVIDHVETTASGN
jgi:uncharacterized protein (TIGR03435 family)